MTTRTPEGDALLTPAEVASMFRVNSKTVTRWARTGKLTSIRTLGGHRRFLESEVRNLMQAVPEQRGNQDDPSDSTSETEGPAARDAAKDPVPGEGAEAGSSVSEAADE